MLYSKVQENVTEHKSPPLKNSGYNLLLSLNHLPLMMKRRNSMWMFTSPHRHVHRHTDNLKSAVRMGERQKKLRLEEMVSVEVGVFHNNFEFMRGYAQLLADEGEHWHHTSHPAQHHNLLCKAQPSEDHTVVTNALAQ